MMHQNFHVKSLGFYGGMTIAVFLLFQGITAYGEKQLKAPISIGGDYRMELEKSPNCLKEQNLLLRIEQSGIYLFATLGLRNTEHNRDRIHLQGRLENQQIVLSGNVSSMSFCIPDSDQKYDSLILTGAFQGKTLTGQLETQTSNLINFKAQLDSTSISKGSHH